MFDLVCVGELLIDFVADAAILVTRGPMGAAFKWERVQGEAAGFKVDAVDGPDLTGMAPSGNLIR